MKSGDLPVDGRPARPLPEERRAVDYVLLPETSSSSSAADSLERLRRWGSEESVNGYYLQRTYRHESATAARCALWGSARPYARYAGGSRQSCVLWHGAVAGPFCAPPRSRR